MNSLRLRLARAPTFLGSGQPFVRQKSKAGIVVAKLDGLGANDCASTVDLVTRGGAPRVVSPDRHGCVGRPLPLVGPAWLWAGGGGGGGGTSTSVWRITSSSVERRIESTAGSPVLGRFAVAADENLNPFR